jgi:hypothetical protein
MANKVKTSKTISRSGLFWSAWGLSVLIPPVAIFSLIYTFRLGEVSPETWDKIDARLEEVYGKAAPEAYPPKEEIQAYTSKIAHSALLEEFSFRGNNFLNYPDLLDIVVQDRAYNDELTSRILEASKNGFAEEYEMENGIISIKDSNQLNFILTRYISLVKSIELNNLILSEQEDAKISLNDMFQLFSVHNPRTSLQKSYRYSILANLLRHIKYLNTDYRNNRSELDTQLIEKILSEPKDENILIFTFFHKPTEYNTTRNTFIYQVFQEHNDLYSAIAFSSSQYDDEILKNSFTWTNTSYHLSKRFSSDFLDNKINSYKEKISDEMKNTIIPSNQLRTLAFHSYFNFYDMHTWDYMIRRNALLSLASIHSANYTREQGRWPKSITELDNFISSRMGDTKQITSKLVKKDGYSIYFTPVESFTKDPVGNYTNNVDRAQFIERSRDIFGYDIPIFYFNNIQLNEFSVTSSYTNTISGHASLDSHPFESTQRCFDSPTDLLSKYFQLRDNRLYVIKAQLLKKQVDAAGAEVWYIPDDIELKHDLENLFTYCSRTETSKYGITDTEKALLPHLQNLQYRLEVEFMLPKQMLAIYTSNAGALTESELLEPTNSQSLREKGVIMSFLPPPGFSSRP